LLLNFPPSNWLPVYQLLGGKFRSKVAVYFGADYPERAKQVVEATNGKVIKTAIESVLDKMRTDGKIKNVYDPDNRRPAERLTFAEIDAMAAHMASIREAVGPEIGIAVDAHNRFDTESAIQLARAFEPVKLLWLEEPVASDNRDELASIRRATKTPIACGENVYTRYGYREILEKQAVSLIQPDVGKCGGLWEARRIAAMAEAHYVPVAAHGVCTPIGTMASAQFCCTIPNFMLQEWGAYFHDEFNAVAEKPKYADGYLEIGDEPGLGVKIHDDVLNELCSPRYDKL
jgi:galactonate dehydratase